MLKNFLTISVRTLTKNGIYSFINIFGLATGMACCILILLWVNDERSFDVFHTKKDRIFQVMKNSPTNNGIQTANSLPLPLAAYLRENEAGVRYAVATDWGKEHLLNHKENKVILPGLYVESDFLKMFSFDLVSGNAETALKDPSGIVLTQSTARSLFGDEAALGKVIRVDDKSDLTVTGIINDVPSNSSLQFTHLMPFEAYKAAEVWVKNVEQQWNTNAFQIFAELQPGASEQDVTNRIENVISKNDAQSKGQLILHPLTKWRLYSMFENGKATGGSIEFVKSLSIVAFFILIIACINFMNLATARSEKRAREVGIRKTIGSGRKQLIIQFLSESLIIAAMSFVLALGIVELSLPFYNSLVNKTLSIPYHEGYFWLIALGIVAVTGVIAGSYPAFYLSSFNPAAVIKGKANSGKRSARPRQVLVALQFGFTIFQIVGTIVFFKQIQHGQERNLGYNRENLLMVGNTGDLYENYEALKQDILSKGLATSVTRSNSPVTQIYAYMRVSWPGKPEDLQTSFATIATDHDYLTTMKIGLLKGRDFSRDYNDSSSVIINERAATLMGMTDPVGKTITWEGREYTIIGVTEEVIMGNPFRPAEPTMIVFMPDWVSDFSLRLPAEKDLNETLAGLENVFEKYNPSYPFSFRFADDEYNLKFRSIQLIGKLANLFSVLAIIISCMGLFGLAAFTAERRTKEIGIRKVMGASVSQMVLMLSKDFAILVLVAFFITAPGAWYAFNMWLDRFPYRISVDWTILVSAGVTALVLAMITVSSQAFRAAVANPVNSLKNE